MDRLARNPADLRRLVRALTGKGASGVGQGEPDLHRRGLPDDRMELLIAQFQTVA
jgi:hypothetical protein